MARTSVIGNAPLSTLKIDDFIFHIIDKAYTETLPVDKIRFSSEADTTFFEEHIKEAAKGTQFVFMENDLGQTQKAVYQQLLTAPDLPRKTAGSFKQISKGIADSFFIAHQGNFNDGILIVARISMTIGTQREKFISLLKVDYSQTLSASYADSGNGETEVTLERIINAISEHKASIQKWALIDPQQNYVWDVLAMERHKAASLDATDKAISQYFRKFLAAQLHKEPKALTKQAPANVLGWASKQAELPEDEHPISYKHRAVKYLESVDMFKDSDFIDFVVGGVGNDDQKKELKDSLKNYMVQKGLYGQQFKPDVEALKASSKKSKIVTDHGVDIHFEGDFKESNISINKLGPNDNEIIIKTTGFEIKS